MRIEKLSLFATKKEFFNFLSVCLCVFCYSLLIEYNNFKNLTQFDTAVVNATIIKQYAKTKLTKKSKIKTYQVLHLKAKQGFTFYSTVASSFTPSINKKIQIQINSNNITFYEFLTNFFAYGKIKHIYEDETLKQTLNNYLDKTHGNTMMSDIYKSLYTATSLPKELQQQFSSLGISHLFAISGFHLGVLSAILYFLLRPLYQMLQAKYFPYRSYSLDSFSIIAAVLLGYLIMLDAPPSLLRSYVMLIIGFVLYDRGYKIVSMWTLFLTVVLIISFAPRLFFALGFWFSVFGVFYIFLFLQLFEKFGKFWQFVLIPIWVYLMMLPHALYIFDNFSIHHPLSIIWTMFFSIFYPLSIIAHIFNVPHIFNTTIESLLNLKIHAVSIQLSKEVIAIFAISSLLAIYKKFFGYISFLIACTIFIYAMYHVT